MVRSAAVAQVGAGERETAVGFPVVPRRSSLPPPHTQRPNDGVGLSLTYRGREPVEEAPPSRCRLTSPPPH